MKACQTGKQVRVAGVFNESIKKNLSKKSNGIDGMDVIIANRSFHQRLIRGETNSRKKQVHPKAIKK